METNKNSTFFPQKQQTNAVHETQLLRREKAPILHVQTNVSAGWYPGYYAGELLDEVGMFLSRFFANVDARL